MSLTVDSTAELLGADVTDASELLEVEEVLTSAVAMVNKYVGDNEVPESLVDLATKKVVIGLWNQMHQRNEVNNSFYEAEGAPAPANRDPMLPAYVLLRRWVLPW